MDNIPNAVNISTATPRAEVPHNGIRFEIEPSAINATAASSNTDVIVSDSYSTVISKIGSTVFSSLKWCPTSERELAEAEKDLLSVLSEPFKTYFVDIGPGPGSRQSSIKIRTLEMMPDTITSDESGEITSDNTQASTKSTRVFKKPPLVLVHGFAAGIGTWILNLDALSTSLDRKIYAIDLVGFARSTRTPFDLSGDVEGQFIDSIERWRTKVGVEKFILLGHSFGGYLSASYALRHPDRVSHVILADPWGIQDRNSPDRRTYRFPIWVRVVTSIFQLMNPLAMLRASGPYGPRLVQKLRGDLREKFRPKLQDEGNVFLNYIYHCNAQSATGESAFKALCLPYGWPKNPLVHRLVDLDPSVSLTFIYGSRSWIEKAPGEYLRDCLTPGRVTVNVIDGSGHHVYADKYQEFNAIVKEACSNVSD